MKQTIKGFGPFELDLTGYTLTRNGHRVRISGSQMELLALFVSRPGGLVTREQIASLWTQPQAVDIRQGINTAVTRVRAILGDDPAAPIYIETVIGKGYRFIAKVQELDQEETGPPKPDLNLFPLSEQPVVTDAMERIAPATGWRTPSWNGTFAAEHLPVAQSSHSPLASNPDNSEPTPAAKPSRRRLLLWGTCAMVVVMSLMALAVGTQLANRPQQGTRVGSLAVAVTTGKDVNRSLAQPVENVGHSHVPVAQIDPQAYDEYLRGRYLWRKRNLPSVAKSIEYFKRSIAEQPGFALPHAGLADAYLSSRSFGLLPSEEATRLARDQAEEAIRLDPQLAEAHTSIAYVHEVSYEWSEAEMEYRRAIAIDPSYALARQRYSNCLSSLGRHAEAIEQARIGIKADPLSPMILTQLGLSYYYARRYDESIAAFKKTLDIEPGYIIPVARLGASYAQKGLYAEALATLRSTSQADEFLAYVEGRVGQTAEAAVLIRGMEEGFPDPMGLLYATLPLGDKTRSFELLHRAVEIHQAGNFAVEPIFDSLRSDPRYREIIREMKLP